MRHRLLGTLCAVSLAGFAGTAAIWVLGSSGFLERQIIFNRRAYTIDYTRSAMSIDFMHVYDWSGAFPLPDHQWTLPGCNYSHSSFGNGCFEWMFELRYWLPLVMFGALPALWVALRVRSRRKPSVRADGFCRSCGYDLRMSPDRCPERGTPIVAVAK